jgi:hypothetical protein
MTLYLTDLDGTLLNSDQRLTPYTAGTVNRFIDNGGFFSYATARSWVTSSQVTHGLRLNLPAICFNGAFIFDAQGDVKLAHYFNREKMKAIRQTLTGHNVKPIIHAYVDGIEKFSYIEDEGNPGLVFHLSTRPGDIRRRPVHTLEELYKGNAFYYVCIGDEKELSPLREMYASDGEVQCIYQRDLYYDAMWLELLPPQATKAQGALALKEMLGCGRLVVFGDGINDLPMFEIADECYAMTNAVPELKKIATAVLDTNDNDGVAKWLEKLL